jgi:hypothetical protein
MLEQVAALAVGGDGDLRPGPLVHLAQLAARGVAGDVDAGVVALGEDPTPRSASLFCMAPIDSSLPGI